MSSEELFKIHVSKGRTALQGKDRTREHRTEQCRQSTKNFQYFCRKQNENGMVRFSFEKHLVDSEHDSY